MLNTKKAMLTAVLSAIGVVLAFILHIPIFPAAPFLEYDMADIPIIFATFALGVPYGLIATIVVSVLQGLMFSASGIIGITMHLFATGMLVVISGAIYSRFNTLKGLIIALITGVIAWIGGMVVWNIVFTPIFTGLPRETVYNMLLPVIVPFNLIKAGANSIMGGLLYVSTFKILSNIIPGIRPLARKNHKHTKENDNVSSAENDDLDI